MSRVFAAGAPGREDEVPLLPAPEPSPFLTRSSPSRHLLTPPWTPVVTMNPAVFLSLTDLRCSLLLLVSVCGDDKPSDCIPDRLPPSARGNSAAPACLDSLLLTRRAPPGEACTPWRCLHFLRFFWLLTPAIHEACETTVWSWDLQIGQFALGEWYVGGHAEAPGVRFSFVDVRTCLGPRIHLMFSPTLGRV